MESSLSVWWEERERGRARALPVVGGKGGKKKRRETAKASRQITKSREKKRTSRISSLPLLLLRHTSTPPSLSSTRLSVVGCSCPSGYKRKKKTHEREKQSSLVPIVRPRRFVSLTSKP